MGGRRWRGDGTYKTVTIRGEKVDITVDTDGVFYGKIGLDSFKFDTLKELMAALRRSANKLKITVAVPATLIHISKHTGTGYNRKYLGETCRRIVLHSINPKSNEINFTYEDDGEKGTQDRWSGRSAKIGKPMTDDEIAEWERLYGEQQAAEKRFRQFEYKFTGDSDDMRRKREPFDAHAVVEAAIRAKADEANEETEVEDEADPRVASVAGSRSRKRR